MTAARTRRARRRAPRWTSRLVGALVVLLAVVPTAGCVPESYTFRGHGYGHGRGMGQWGALGYAVDHGWSGTQILGRFYRGTTTRSVPATQVRAYLTATKGKDLIVTQTAGALRVDGFGANVAAVRVARLGAGRFRIWRGSGCGGPWTLVGDRSAGSVAVRSAVTQGDDPTRMPQLCTATGTTYYRGALHAVDALGTIVTVNEVHIESLVRSIVPQEVSPSWADLGGGRGAAAVRAQAVAARSYALFGDSRWAPWATTCDSVACQAYVGYGQRAAGSSTIVRHEDPRTNAAVNGTSLQVRMWPDGRIAATEFSSSTGGWTAGGAFAAVPDDGDDIAANPHHSWSKTVSRAAIETAFDRRQGRDMGALQGFDSIVRNGIGDMGGRVTSIRARFSGGTVTLSGDALRALLGLKSAWFTP